MKFIFLPLVKASVEAFSASFLILRGVGSSAELACIEVPALRKLSPFLVLGTVVRWLPIYNVTVNKLLL